VGEGAYQKAVAWARERVQGGVPIIQHADVKRMLLTMRALNEAMRAFAYSEAITMDRAHHLKDAAQQSRIDLVIPVIKGWLTEVGVELASLGMQVHGGMGYIEETGAAQYLRDVRIAAIYEGTNGIQAQDLVARKLCRDGGRAMVALLAEVDATVTACDGELAGVGAGLQRGLEELRRTTAHLLAEYSGNEEVVMGKAFDYLMQLGYVMGAWHMARAAVVSAAKVAGGSDNPFYGRKISTTRFYMENILPRARGYAAVILDGGPALRAYPEHWL
jgi:hypothetical protein